MVVDELYGSSQYNLSGADEPFVFNEKVIDEALTRIYNEEFNISTDIEVGLFKETLRGYNLASANGFAKSETKLLTEFINQVKYNNAVFSAFKVHRMQNDIASKLLDEKGKLKPFKQFALDVEPITNHHVKNWLQTEYSTAIRRAHIAADWKGFESNADILPNLRWLRTTSPSPDDIHEHFWETVLPINHPFWDKHKPGDRWNCKCGLEATDEKPKDAPTSNGNDKPAPGLDNNPAKDGMLFSLSHPYYKEAYLPYSKLDPIVKKFVSKQTGKK